MAGQSNATTYLPANGARLSMSLCVIGRRRAPNPRHNRNGDSHEHKIYPVVIHQEIHERDEEKGEEQDAFYSGHSRSPFPNFSLLVNGARAKLLS